MTGLLWKFLRRVLAPRPKKRCGESARGHQCIYDAGHKGDHFAKDSWSYYAWPQFRGYAWPRRSP